MNTEAFPNPVCVREKNKQFVIRNLGEGCKSIWNQDLKKITLMTYFLTTHHKLGLLEYFGGEGRITTIFKITITRKYKNKLIS